MTNSSSSGSPAFDALLETAASWVVLGTLVWGAVLALAALVERGSRGRLPALRWVGCPRRARPLLLAVAGLAVLVPGAAHAVTTGAADGPRPGRATLPVPTRPTDRPADRPATGPEPDAGVTVRHGDSLWALSRTRLGPGAGDAEVAALVGRLHRRNLAVVGPDPDLLRPGQRLRFPTTALPTPSPSTEAP